MGNNEKPRLGYIHRFIVPSDEMGKRQAQGQKGDRNKFTTFLLLHGTGGNEEDLIPLAQQLCQKAAILSPRGKVLENGVAPRFFRRLAEGVFDIEDLKYRTNELADFVKDASNAYDFDVHNVIAVGYSNGANMGASILLLRPEILSGAILFRAMVPLIPEILPNLTNKHIFMSSGVYDPIVTRRGAEKLFGLFRKAGAKVTINWQESGHELTMEEVQIAREWLQKFIVI
jgi:phospholipase/carboxylesterase